MRSRLSLLLVLALLVPAACSQPAEPVEAPASGSLDNGWAKVEGAYVRPSLPPHDLGAGFFVLENLGEEDLVVVGVESAMAGSAELHTMVEVQGVMRMRPAESFLAPIGGKVELAPGGKHLMFFDLTEPWVEGMSVPLVLRLADGRNLELKVPVRLPESSS